MNRLERDRVGIPINNLLLMKEEANRQMMWLLVSKPVQNTKEVAPVLTQGKAACCTSIKQLRRANHGGGPHLSHHATKSQVSEKHQRNSCAFLQIRISRQRRMLQPFIMMPHLKNP